jgi:hypothetical protein
MVAAIHPLTPGSPAYALLKVSAVGGLFALRLFMARRSRAADEAGDKDEGPAPEAEPTAERPHPVSRRKARRRRRRRS